MTAERPLRFCDVCGGLDDHPRHVAEVPRDAPDLVVPDLGEISGPAPALAQLFDPRVSVRHMDCCAASGCGICAQTEADNEGRRGQDLIDHLTKQREGV